MAFRVLDLGPGSAADLGARHYSKPGHEGEIKKQRQPAEADKSEGVL